MQSSENNQQNLDYAKEWISFLRRRNLVLTFIWPILLITSILLSIASFYYYQLDQKSNLDLILEKEKNQILERDKLYLLSEIDVLTKSNDVLNSELDTLNNAREELSVKNDDSASKLNITSQMIDNLNALVAELKNERTALTNQLEESLKTIHQLKNQHQDFVKQSDKEKTDSIADLNKQLESRKSAYLALANRQQEMRNEIDRLSNMVSQKEQQIEKLTKDKQNLNARLTEKGAEVQSYKNKLADSEKNYKALESKMNAFLSPISSSTVNKSEQNLEATQQADISKKITGLEEIKKPAVQVRPKNDVKPNQSTDPQNYDFNKISIVP